MTDVFLPVMVSLVSFALILIMAKPGQRGLWAGYAHLAVMAGWFLAGWLASISLIVIGAVLAGEFWHDQNRSRARLAQVFRWMLIWAIVPTVAMLVSAIVGLPSSLIAANREISPVLMVVLICGWTAGLLVHWLLYRKSPTLRELLIEFIFVVLTDLLPVMVSASGIVALYVLVALLGVLAYHHWHTASLRLQIQRQQQEIAVHQQIGQFTGGHLDQDALLWNIYQHLEAFLNMTIFYIALYDAERDMIVYPLAVIGGKKVGWKERKPGSDDIIQNMRQDKLIRVGHSQMLIRPETSLSKEGAESKHYLGVPLLIGSELAGVVAVLNSEPNTAYNQQDIKALHAVASQVGLAIYRTRLRAEQTGTVDKLSQINDSVHQILFNRNRDSALEAACKLASRICGSDHVALFLVDDASDTLHLQTHTGLNEKYVNWVQHHLPDIPNGPRVSAHLPESSMLHQVSGFQAMAELPIRSDRLKQGMLIVYYTEPHSFRSRELDLLETLVNHVSAMLGNVELFEVMESYAYEMSELVQLSRISTSSLDIDGVVHDIADMLRQMTSMNRVAIIALEGKRARLLATVSSLNDTTSGNSDVYLELFSELTQLNQLPTPDRRAYQRTEAHLSPAMREQMTLHQEQTVALVPLVVNLNVLGAVWLGSQEQRVFAERDWQFIEMATNQIAAQIRNIQLHEQTQQELNRRLKQVSIIEEIARQVSSSLDFNVIIDHVLEAALNATGADLASLGLVSENDTFRLIEHRIQAGQAHKRHSAQPLQDGIMGQVLQTKQAIIVSDNRADPHYVSEYDYIYESSLAVPLFKGETVIGVLNVEASNPRVFNNEHVLFLVNLASHAVISIDNARFVEERQNEIERLKNLRDLSLWLVSADDTRSVGYEILETALQLLDGQNSILYQYDRQTEQLKTLARLWYSEQANTTVDEILPDEVAHQAIASKQVVVIEDVEQHPAWTDSAPFNYRSVLAFPLRHFEQIQFVILITKEERYSLVDQDMSTIDLLSSQAIGHLENARLHERIREGRDQMRAILNATQDGLILLDSAGHIIEANPSACHLSGINLSQHVGDSFDAIIHNGLYSEQAIEELMTTLRQQPAAESRRAFQYMINQQIHHIEETARPVRDDSERIVGRLLVLRDVTEIRLLEEQREDLADMVVHDLRGPLGAIINALNLAMPVLGSPDDLADIEQLLQGSIVSAKRLLTLVNTLLDISKMQHSGLDLTCQPEPFAMIAEIAVLSLTSLAEQSDITVTLDLGPDLPQVNIDREIIERVVINLLDNALRYTPDGGQIRIVASVVDEGWLQIRIADSGPGIPPDRRQHVFQRFERILGQNPQRGHRGHGLGLTFTRLAVEAHGGTIHLGDDDQLTGACFIFTLPIAE